MTNSRKFFLLASICHNRGVLKSTGFQGRSFMKGGMHELFLNLNHSDGGFDLRISSLIVAVGWANTPRYDYTW